MDKKRVHVVISGRVQGVFFRAETRRAAIQYGVSGWVRNKQDGTVEAVFEGDEKQISTILDWCWKGSPHSSVENIDIKEENYTGEFSDFKITY